MRNETFKTSYISTKGLNVLDQEKVGMNSKIRYAALTLVEDLLKCSFSDIITVVGERKYWNYSI